MKSPQVILVQPYVGYMDSLRSAPSPPLALMAAASQIDSEICVRILDQRVDPNWRANLRQWLRETHTICVGLTGYTSDMLLASQEAAHIVRSEGHVPLVWGGIHTSLVPDQVIREHVADYVVAGEGERAFGRLVEELSAGHKPPAIPGVLSKRTQLPFEAPPLLPADELPLLPNEILSLDVYLPRYKGIPTLYTQSSRGCPCGCRYCYNVVYNRRRWRAIPEDALMEHVLALSKRLEFGSVYFVDDNFFVDLPRAMCIAERFSNSNLDWEVQGVDIQSVAAMSDEQLRTLENSGLKRMSIGVESGSERVREIMDKQGDPDLILRQIRRLRDYDINVFVSFVTGLPGESLEDTRMTVSLVLQLLKINPRLRNSPIYLYTPFPGTEMFHRAVEDGFVPPQTMDGWARIGEWDRTSGGDQITKRILEALHFTSLFLDRKIDDYGGSFLVRVLMHLYRPIARLRLRLFFFRLMPERVFFSAMLKRRFAQSQTQDVNGINDSQTHNHNRLEDTSEMREADDQ